MSKIDRAISEIHSIENMAKQDKWLNEIHPLVKLMVTLIYIATVVSYHKYNLAGLLGMMIYPIVLFIVGEIPFQESIYRLRIVLPLVCFVGIFNPFFDRQALIAINGITISAGEVSMITLMGKGILTVMASYLLIATTTIEKICYALRLLRVPQIVVTQILLIYRYVTVLLAEANRITQAYSLRAPNQKGVHFKVWGSLIGQLLLRSMDKADNIYESMCLRGYRGEFYSCNNIKCKVNDYCYLIVWITIIGILRIVPVLQLVGNIFI